MRDDFQNEVRFLGIESSPEFVRGPEDNGYLESFFKTIKEQLLWVRHFRSTPEPLQVPQDFRTPYDRLSVSVFSLQWQARQHLAIESSA